MPYNDQGEIPLVEAEEPWVSRSRARGKEFDPSYGKVHVVVRQHHGVTV